MDGKRGRSGASNGGKGEHDGEAHTQAVACACGGRGCRRLAGDSHGVGGGSRERVDACRDADGVHRPRLGRGRSGRSDVAGRGASWLPDAADAERGRILLRAGPDPYRVRVPVAAEPGHRRDRPHDRHHRRVRQLDADGGHEPVQRLHGSTGDEPERDLSGRAAVADRSEQRVRLGGGDDARRHVGARHRARREDRPRRREVEQRLRHPQRDAVRRRSQSRRHRLAELRRGGAVHGVGSARAAARGVLTARE